MTLEERLLESLSEPQARDMLRESVEHVLRSMGWSEEELAPAADMVVGRITSLPVVESNVTD